MKKKMLLGSVLLSLCITCSSLNFLVHASSTPGIVVPPPPPSFYDDTYIPATPVSPGSYTLDMLSDSGFNMTEETKEQLSNGTLTVEQYLNNNASYINSFSGVTYANDVLSIDNNMIDLSASNSGSSTVATDENGVPYNNIFGTKLNAKKGNLINNFNFINNNSAYGGNQGFWDKGTYKEKTGCGSVAACNIMAYHALNFSRSKLFPYTYWSFENWKKFQDLMFDKYAYGPTTGVGFTKAVIKYAADRGYRYWGTGNEIYPFSTTSNLNYFANFIQGSIDSNNPVAILLGPKLPYTYYNNNFENHWVTVTSYDFTNGNYFINVSSWGSEYTLDLRKLYKNRLFMDAFYYYRY